MVLNAEQNNLSLLNFKFKLDRTPEIEYRIQSVDIPGLNLGYAETPSPFVRLPFPGNLSYDTLNILFLVGEEMKDYLGIFDWMVSLGHPDRLSQYNPEQAVSDCSVLILNSAMRPIINCKFTDAFPVSLSSLSFDTTLPDVQYATATASFKFTRFYYNPII
jgi:hypothetical protein